MTTFNDTVVMAKVAGTAGSESNKLEFECQTTGGVRKFTVRAKPYNASIDDYWLEFLRNDGSRLAILEDFTYVSGYADGVLNLTNAGIFCPWLAQFYGARIEGQTHAVNAGATYDIGALSDAALLAQSMRVPCYPSSSQGCVVNLPTAAYGLRYEVGDYSGLAATNAISIYNKTGETINGVDYSSTPLLINTAYKQLTLQGDDITGTNWIIK